LRLAKQMGIPETDWKHFAAGALLHDIGKIGVPDAVLLKGSRLTALEWQQMRLHPLIGNELLKGVGHLAVEREVVLAHHEHWNGAGYPRGLAGDTIPLPARIFSVADALDAITSDRPYRKRRSFEEAQAEITRCTGSQFDPRVAAAFLHIPLQEWEEIQRQAQAEQEVFLRQDSAGAAEAEPPEGATQPESLAIPYALGAPRPERHAA
jgi:HD-GYP domain-containing protein (c-di-GMP phosphodiesterase class II)